MSSVFDKLKEKLDPYIYEIENVKKSEAAKLNTLSIFIHDVFSIESIELDSEIPTTSEILQLRGRIDTMFGNVMIEFKKDLRIGLDTAKKNYTNIYNHTVKKLLKSMLELQLME